MRPFPLPSLLCRAVLLAGALLVACAAPPPATEEVPVADTSEANLAAIRALHGTYMEAYNDGDVETLANLFTPDAIRIPPFAPPIVGEAAIRADFANLFATTDAEVTIIVVEARLSGDFAFARGTWAVNLTPKSGGETTTDVGKWLTLLERQPDGSWKASRNIWNSDQAPA